MIFKYNLLNKICLLITKRNLTHKKNLCDFIKQKYQKMDKNTRIRLNPIVTKLDTPEFKSIFTPELMELISLFKKYNHELRIAGGAVRDLVMRKTPKDIDFATTATPDVMKDMFEAENIRMINMNGEKHGTITPRINDKENFEITTLRIDVVNNGRHAEVLFSKDWLLDANRRDLTINSMFLDFDGNVYDYFYGYDDLLEKRILFVGDADTRIKEDYLRILRYFRFYGRIADNPYNHDESTIKAIKNNAIGMEKISGERIWGEIKKILQGNYAYEIMLDIIECDIDKYIGLPEKPNVIEFHEVCENHKLFNDEPNSITLMSALLNTPNDALKLHQRLKFSAYERDLCLYLTTERDINKDSNELSVYKQMCFNKLGQYNTLKSMVLELLKYRGIKEIHESLNMWNLPKFPVKGNSLKTIIKKKIEIGLVLNKLRGIWMENNFNLTEDDLLKEVPSLLKELNDSVKLPSDTKKPKFK